MSTPREKQVAHALDTRRRQVELELEHERFDVRVTRGEWPTEKVGELFGIEVFRVDGSVPVLAIMGFQHNVTVHYESVRLGRPLDTANDLLLNCDLAWVGCRKQFFVSTVGWRKLKRSIERQSAIPPHSPEIHHAA